MWGHAAAPVPSIWEPQVRALAPRGRVAIDGKTTRRPAPKIAATMARPKDADGQDVYGTVLWFDTLSCEKDLPSGLRDKTGFESAQIMIRPGAFDKCLRRCKTGNVTGSVRFQFSHLDETKTASTISGTLKLAADAERLFFYVTGSTRDGASSIKRAKTFAECREVSAGFYVRQGIPVPGERGEPNTVVVTEAQLFEVSLVQAGAFPRTEVHFL